METYDILKDGKLFASFTCGDPSRFGKPFDREIAGKEYDACRTFQEHKGVWAKWELRIYEANSPLCVTDGGKMSRKQINPPPPAPPRPTFSARHDPLLAGNCVFRINGIRQCKRAATEATTWGAFCWQHASPYFAIRSVLEQANEHAAKTDSITAHDAGKCDCRDPRTVWNGTREQWICDDCKQPAAGTGGDNVAERLVAIDVFERNSRELCTRPLTRGKGSRNEHNYTG